MRNGVDKIGFDVVEFFKITDVLQCDGKADVGDGRVVGVEDAPVVEVDLVIFQSLLGGTPKHGLQVGVREGLRDGLSEDRIGDDSKHLAGHLVNENNARLFIEDDNPVCNVVEDGIKFNHLALERSGGTPHFAAHPVTEAAGAFETALDGLDHVVGSQGWEDVSAQSNAQDFPGNRVRIFFGIQQDGQGGETLQLCGG